MNRNELKKQAYALCRNYPYKIIIISECFCKDTKKVKHHPDYNKPFEVTLLCVKCHGSKHWNLRCEATTSSLIGKFALYELGTMQATVKIVDVRNAFGRTDYRIEPVAGVGGMWVSSNLTFEKDS